jgi:hypothetical protein
MSLSSPRRSLASQKQIFPTPTPIAGMTFMKRQTLRIHRMNSGAPARDAVLF